MVGKKDNFTQKGNQHSKSSLSACPLPILSAAAATHFCPLYNSLTVFLCLKGPSFPAHHVFLGSEDYATLCVWAAYSILSGNLG